MIAHTAKDAGSPGGHSHHTRRKPGSLGDSEGVSVTKSCPNPRGPIDSSILVSLSFTVSWSFLKFKSIELVMLSNTSSSALPSPFAFNLSQHQGLFQ